MLLTPPSFLPVVAQPLLIILIGESNSGGAGTNALLSASELASRTTKILNNTSLVFEDLGIGINNLIGHSGLTDNATHGCENGFANAYDWGRLGTKGLYLTKCGQGGSRVGQWASGDASGYWSTAVTRIDAALAAITALGFTADVKVFLSLGINDLLVATSTSAYEAGMLTLLSQLRTKLGASTPVVMTRFMANYSGYDANITNLVAANPNNFAVTTSDLDLYVANTLPHWDYNALRTIAERAVDQWAASQAASALSFSPVDGTYGSTQTVTVSASPAADQIRYTLDGSPAQNTSTLYTGPVSIPFNNQKLSAVALRQNTVDGYSTADYVIGAALNEITWTSLVAASQVGNYLQFTAVAPCGGRASNSIDATNPFSVYVDWTSAGYLTATVVYLDDHIGTNYGFDGSNTYMCGFYGFQNSLVYTTTVGGGAASTGILVPLPSLMRFSKSGNDCLLHNSADGGSSWSLVKTFTDALLGKTTIYLKALNAAPTGNEKIRVRYA